MTVTAADVAGFLASLEARDTGDATALALRLADDGAPVPEVLVDLVGAAQIEVGERWQRNEYSIADEHAATAISDIVVSVLTANPVPIVDRPNVVVLCANGEWHLLAARLIAEVLRGNGFAITFLGASMPASHLSRFLRSNRDIDVVAISCSTPLAFAGAVSCVAVAHDAGVPVIVGGRALGTDGTRAESIGADLWAPDAQSAVWLLHDPLPTTFRSSSVDVASAMMLGLQRTALVEAAMSKLSQDLPSVRVFSEEQLDRTREDFAYILEFAEAATLMRDRRVFDEFVQWLDPLLQARGLPASILPMSLHILGQLTDVPASLSELLA